MVKKYDSWTTPKMNTRMKKKTPRTIVGESKVGKKITRDKSGRTTSRGVSFGAYG